jgi:hypothetical protein
MNEQIETEAAEVLLEKARKFADFYASIEDHDAAVMALLVRTIELATGREVTMENMYK